MGTKQTAEFRQEVVRIRLRIASITVIVAASITPMNIKRGCANTGSKYHYQAMDNATMETFFKTIKAELI